MTDNDNVTPLHPEPQPDSDHVFVDENGRTYFRYSAGYQIDGETWGVDFFAQSYEEAVRRLKAIGETGEVHGQVYTTVPA